MTVDGTHSPASRLHAHRRTVLMGAAWSAPAVVVASAAPAFATSGPEGTVTWGATNGSVLQLGLLNGQSSGGGLVTASVLPDGPQGFTIQNPNNTPLSGVTADVAITYAGGIPLLSAKGYGVYAANGNPALVTNRAETYRGIGIAGTYETTQTISLPDVASGDTWVPINFGLTNGGVLGISVLVSFRAEITLKSSGTTLDSAITPLTLPVGLNLL